MLDILSTTVLGERKYRICSRISSGRLVNVVDVVSTRTESIATGNMTRINQRAAKPEKDVRDGQLREVGTKVMRKQVDKPWLSNVVPSLC